MGLYTDAVIGTEPQAWRQLLQSIPAHWPHGHALLHKSRGAWLSWSWQDVLNETDRLGASMRQIGIGPGDTVAFSGEINPSLILLALAAKTIGAVTVAIPVEVKADELAQILSGPLSLAVVQKRDQLALWLDVLRYAGAPATIIYDQAALGPGAGHDSTAVLSLAQFRDLTAPKRSANAVKAGPQKPLAAALTCVEESTDWPDVFDIVFEAWLSQSTTLVLPELLAAAARDRAVVQPNNWIVSPKRLTAAAGVMTGRLPAATGFTGRLVGRALRPHSTSGIDRLIRRLLRRHFGLSRLRTIDLAANSQNLVRGLEQAAALLTALGAPARDQTDRRRRTSSQQAAGFALAGRAE